MGFKKANFKIHTYRSIKEKNKTFKVKHLMTKRQSEMILAGSLINVVSNESQMDMI